MFLVGAHKPEARHLGYFMSGKYVYLPEDAQEPSAGNFLPPKKTREKYLTGPLYSYVALFLLKLLRWFGPKNV